MAVVCADSWTICLLCTLRSKLKNKCLLNLSSELGMFFFFFFHLKLDLTLLC